MIERHKVNARFTIYKLLLILELENLIMEVNCFCNKKAPYIHELKQNEQQMKLSSHENDTQHNIQNTKIASSQFLNCDHM